VTVPPDREPDAGAGRGPAAGIRRGQVVGIDIGGTKVAAGVVDGAGRVLDRELRSTPGRDPAGVRQTVVEVVTALRARHDVLAVGIGAAGIVDPDGGRVLFSPHLAWRDEPLRDETERALGVPVVVDNDANAAAWAEWRFGAARGRSHVVCVNLGTGIGGGMVADGTVRRGRWGLAGEFGHMIAVPDGRSCECGNRGCLEQYASGNVLGRRARELAGAGRPAAARLLELAGGDAAAITGRTVTAAAADGDPLAVELFADVGHWLGIGLANLAAALDPEVLVVGGGVCDAGELLLGPARESFRVTLPGRGFRPEPPIVRAELGPEAGLVGAADLARSAVPVVPG